MTTSARSRRSDSADYFWIIVTRSYWRLRTSTTATAYHTVCKLQTVHIAVPDPIACTIRSARALLCTSVDAGYYADSARDTEPTASHARPGSSRILVDSPSKKINLARRRKKTSRKSEIHFTSEVTPDFSKSFFSQFSGPILLFFCSILLVLVRSAQTAHVVYTLCAELVFWS